ncbi:MAG: hypothetical protein ABEH83_00905 [Halobacterium sp.]
MDGSMNELSEKVAEQYVSYAISTFEVMYMLMTGFLSILLLLWIFSFTANYISPWIFFALYVLFVTYIVRFVFFGYRMLLYLWRNLRPPYDPDHEVIRFPFSLEESEIKLGSEVTTFAVLIMYLAMSIWVVISFVIIRYIEPIVGFIQFSYNFVPDQVSTFGVSLIASILGFGGATDSAGQLGLAGAIEALLWIPILLLGLLVCWNAVYSIEIYQSRNKDIQPFLSKSGVQELREPTWVLLSTSYRVCDEHGRRFLVRILASSIIFLICLAVSNQFSVLTT